MLVQAMKLIKAQQIVTNMSESKDKNYIELQVQRNIDRTVSEVNDLDTVTIIIGDQPTNCNPSDFKDLLESENDVNDNNVSLLNDSLTDSSYPDESETMNTGRRRQKTKDETKWKQNGRKRKRPGGSEYVNTKGEVKRAKQVKTVKDCQGRCRYKCAHFFTAKDRKDI